MEITKRLLMTFKTDEGKNISITVDEPRENLTEQEIINTMNIIVNNDVFAPNGEALVEKVGAKVVETETQEYDLVL